MSDDKMREALAKYMETRWGKTSNVFFLASLESAYADAWQASRNAQSEADAGKRVEPMAYARKSGLESLPFSNAGQIALTLFKEARPDRVALGVINDATAAPAQSEAKPVKGNLADRLDAMADRSRMGSQEASDLYAAATIWRKHISRHATPVPIKPAESSDRHSDDEAVDQFARLMREKMAVSRAKGRHGWDDPEQCDTEDLVAMMVEHITKGDVIDIANFCMMLHWRGATADMIRAACGDYFAPIGAGDAEDAARYREVRSGYGVNADLKPPVTLIYATVYEHKKGSIPSTRAVIGQELDRLVDAALLAKRGGA